MLFRSPLVSKLRENAKVVIGVGVKNSTSELLVNNCDEFMFYDDLVRKPPKRKAAPKKKAQKKAARRSGIKSEADKQDEGIDLVVDTAEALTDERGDRVWGSMIKQTLKRRRPGFSESYYGFRSFGDLLEEAEDRGLLELEADDRSGGYMIKAVNRD